MCPEFLKQKLLWKLLADFHSKEIRVLMYINGSIRQAGLTWGRVRGVILRVQNRTNYCQKISYWTQITINSKQDWMCICVTERGVCVCGGGQRKRHNDKWEIRDRMWNSGNSAECRTRWREESYKGSRRKRKGRKGWEMETEKRVQGCVCV